MPREEINFDNLTPKEKAWAADLVSDFRSAFSGEMGVGLGQKADAVPPHGVNALLSAAGVNPNMHSTVVAPSNFAEALPLYPSENENELFEVITGQTADSGTNPENVCSNPTQTGYLKVAQVVATFGQIWHGTKQINVADHLKRLNRADINRNLLNYAGNPANKYTPMLPTGNDINTVVRKEFLEFGTSMQLNMSHVMVQGLLTNTGASAQTGFIKEFDGISRWIRTGYTDNVSSVAAEALDSLVTDYGSGLLDGDAYTHLANVRRTLRMNGLNMGMGEVVHLLLMHPYAMFPLVDTVACNFYTTRCSTTGLNDGQSLAVHALNQEMMNNMYIPVDNQRVPFVWDWSVPATYNAATDIWESDFFFVPLMDGVGDALTYVEYLPFNTVAASELFNTGGPSDEFMLFNNGMYVARRSSGENLCIIFKFHAQMRLVMRTPWLAGRVDNVDYNSSTPFRSPIIGDTYHKNGGRYLRS